MPRHQYKRTPLEKDRVYSSEEVSRLINYLMIDGKKTVAQRIVYGVFNDIKKDGKDPLQILHQAISHVAPNYEVRPRRLGGASYLVPIEVRKERRLFLALNWIINAAATRSNKEFKDFGKKLYHELMEAAKNEGQAVGKKAQTEKLAEANKAFAHLKW